MNMIVMLLPSILLLGLISIRVFLGKSWPTEPFVMARKKVRLRLQQTALGILRALFDRVTVLCGAFVVT